MKIDFIDDTDSQFLNKEMLRIFDFNEKEINDFYNLINEEVIKNEGSVSLSEYDFIDQVNCELELKIGEKSIGIVEKEKNKFVCVLTIKDYIDMIGMIEPFLLDPSYGHQYLLDPLDNIELLLSEGGGW